MKNLNVIILYLLLTIISLATTGQGVVLNLNKRAKVAFDQYAYDQARDLYLESYRKDSSQVEVIRGLAYSYIKLNNSVEAEYWLEKLIQVEDADTDNLNYALVQQYSKNGKYDQAAVALEGLRMGEKERYRSEALSKLDEYQSTADHYGVEPVFFNSDKSDFGALYYDDTLVAFVSARAKNSWMVNRYNWDRSEYLDFYMVNPLKPTNDSLVSKPMAIKTLNSAYHEGPGQLYDNNSKIVFTRNHLINNRLGRQDEGISKLQIYFAEKNKEGKWDNFYPFDQNIVNYSFGHPTITSDGDTLIFASEMPGGFGGTDLYMSVRQDSTWSVPRNLGDKINTEGEEFFPFLDGNRLYFASDTWPGVGGLDIFETELGSGSDPRNLGVPINSSQDDFGLITKNRGKSGYFSTDRLGGDDIFSFKAQFYTLRGKVLKKPDNQIVPDAIVTVLNESGEVIAQATSDDEGNFLLDMSEYGNLQAFSSAPGLHTKDSVSINIPVGFLGERNVQLYLDESLITIEVVDDSTLAPVDHPVYYFKQLNSKNTLTPLHGDHSYQFQPGHTYEIFATAHGYFSARDTLETSTELVESFTHQVKLKKVVVGERIRLDHIYYDLNSANLREESMEELDKVVKFLEDNAELNIELSSHTDSRGSDAYNLQLSQKRAESATNYLLSKGIEPSRIIPKGYGESKLVNRCVNGASCSAEEHQANRRTELKIL